MNRIVVIATVFVCFAGGHVPTSAFAVDNSAALSALNLAKHYYDKRDYKRAAERFHEAYAIERNVAFLYNAARAEQRAFMLEAAERDFQNVIDATKDEAILRKARVRLQEVIDMRGKLKASEDARKKAEAAKTQAEQQQKEAVAAKVAAQSASRRRRPSTSLGVKLLYAGAAASLVAGGVMYGLAWSTRKSAAAMEEDIAEADSAEEANTLLDEHAALTRASDIQRLVSISSFVASGGLAVAGFLLMRQPGDASTARLHVVPWTGGRGLTLGARF